MPSGSPPATYQAYLSRVGQIPFAVPVSGTSVPVADLTDIPLEDGVQYHAKVRALFPDGSTADSDVLAFMYSSTFPGGVVSVETDPGMTSLVLPPPKKLDVAVAANRACGRVEAAV